MVYIKPSTRLRTDYSQIAELARRTGDAIYITKNGGKGFSGDVRPGVELRDLVLKTQQCSFGKRKHKIKRSSRLRSGRI